IPDVLFDEPVAVVAPDDGVGEIEILDDGLQLAAVAFGDLAAEDHRELAGLADRAVGIQQALAQGVERRPPMEDQVVAILNLGKEQAMAAAGVLPLPDGEERGEARQPLLPAAREIPRGEGVSEVLEPARVPAFQEGIGALLEVDALRPQLSGQPVVLVEADTGRKGPSG